jgi:hypothetical protein
MRGHSRSKNGVASLPYVSRIHAFLRPKNVDGRDIGEPSGLVFGKPKDELRDAISRRRDYFGAHASRACPACAFMRADLG